MQYTLYTGGINIMVNSSGEGPGYSVGSLNYGENFVDIYPQYGEHYINFRSPNSWRDGWVFIHPGDRNDAYGCMYWHDMPLYKTSVAYFPNALAYRVTGGTTLYDQHGTPAINLNAGDQVFCDANVGCDAMARHTDRLKVFGFLNSNGFCYAPYNAGYVDTGIAGAVADTNPLVRGNW